MRTKLLQYAYTRPLSRGTKPRGHGSDGAEAQRRAAGAARRWLRQGAAGRASPAQGQPRRAGRAPCPALQHGCSAHTGPAPTLLAATGRARGSAALVLSFFRCLFARRGKAKPADSLATLRLAHPLNTSARDELRLPAA